MTKQEERILFQNTKNASLRAIEKAHARKVSVVFSEGNKIIKVYPSGKRVTVGTINSSKKRSQDLPKTL